ncbi:hypothetical protein LJB81_02650 [Desulfovibrio sp. OttesenSCG-928-M14]|nr:hypothetical protein [Desulfovibrio sp. OttesenSCG-928-M16]MDL2216618.1 hypothetical protein [Desulfovibrio sp. OttesenSCG-928-M14]MDL2291094.1 hypothetical protein [Desulfovibrio sp. OttesenSCG-928-F20]
MKPTYATILILFLSLLLAPAFAAPVLGYDGERTYDTLTPEEGAELERLTDLCFKKIEKEALTLLQARFDVHTILRTFMDQIRVIRQRNRALFLDVERYLYSLRLNTEFIDSYMNNLREDTVMHALDVLIQRSRGKTI